jgi:hypothetical protein
MTTPDFTREGAMPRGLTFSLIILLAPVGAVAQHEGHQPTPAPSPQQDGARSGHDHEMTGLFGPYPMSRESSGTSWQPESTPMIGYHFTAGPWMLMAHGAADAVYDHQGGARGQTEFYAPTMGMLMAHRPAGRGTFGLRGMLSLDPATVGSTGYSLLLQTGETADGVTPLIDRQHPHDFLMELAASYSVPFRDHGSVFAYVGLPGEPALGPPTFMHRFSGLALPESPIMHHWLDSTHITFGVATVGVAWKGLRLEGSSFTGREPDQHRWDFDAPRFDSFSGRLSVNPTADLAFQLSAGHLNSPEQLEPDVDVDRYTASAIYNRPLAGGANWQTTATWGLNRKEGRSQDGLLLESTWWSGRRHTVFLRAETVEKDELFASEPLSDEVFQVAKLSGGYAYEISRLGRVGVGIGGLVSLHHVPDELKPTYGDGPASFMLFVRSVVR